MSITLVCSPTNDLWCALSGADYDVARFDSADDALAATAPGDALFLLADGYPAERTLVPAEVWERVRGGQLRLYVEYPGAVPGVTLGEPVKARWDRVIVSSDAFSPRLEPLRILMAHSCQYLPADVPGAHLVLARVAGFDTAVYGLPGERHALLLECEEGNALVATTALSRFRKSRFAPAEAWRTVWTWVLRTVTGDDSFDMPDWTPTVRPSFRRNDALGEDAEREAVERGAEWFRNAKLFIHPLWEDEARGRLHTWEDGTGPGPDVGWPLGDGSCGMTEGANSTILPDGSQLWRYFLRNDCMGEASMAVGLSEALGCNAWGRRVARNTNDFIYTYSNLARERRANPESPSYGLINWDTRAPEGGIYYGDDNARSMLGTMAASAAVGTERWDEPLLRCLLANLRTTGPLGFRGGRISGNELERHGWRYFWHGERTHFAPHYESWLWACFLWAYARTGFAPFLDRAKKGIALTMEAYPDEWRWTNGIQQERARMLLPLAWLVRVEDAPAHREWLRFMAGELLAHQAECGAIREEVGSRGKGSYAPPASNEAYGTSEAPLIQQNGDPLCDLLYTTNFAFAGLHEAAAATSDDALVQAENRLAEFLCRAQVRSEEHPELDGAWFRAFEFDRWDYWASNADLGWGAWSIESGWTQSWITAVLALRQMRTSLWEYTAGSRIGDLAGRLAAEMLPEEDR